MDIRRGVTCQTMSMVCWRRRWGACGCCGNCREQSMRRVRRRLLATSAWLEAQDLVRVRTLGCRESRARRGEKGRRSPFLGTSHEIEPCASILIVLQAVLDKCFRLDYSTATPAWTGAGLGNNKPMEALRASVSINVRSS